jgi:hypothetical protein
VNISKETLTKLARFDTPTICNVIELFDIRPRNRGYMDGRIKSNFPVISDGGVAIALNLPLRTAPRARNYFALRTNQPQPARKLYGFPQSKTDGYRDKNTIAGHPPAGPVR